MRWINYSLPGRSPSYGIVEGERIFEVGGSPFGDHDRTGQIHRLVDITTELPFVSNVLRRRLELRQTHP